MLVLTIRNTIWEVAAEKNRKLLDELIFEPINGINHIILEHDKGSYEVAAQDILKIEVKPDNYILQKITFN